VKYIVYFTLELIIIITIIIIISSLLATGLFSPELLLLNRRRFPPLSLQVSNCITLSVLCDVSSTAVFCLKSIECFPSMASKFYFRLSVTNPLTPVITGLIIHFTYHIPRSIYLCTYYYYIHQT